MRQRARGAAIAPLPGNPLRLPPQQDRAPRGRTGGSGGARVRRAPRSLKSAMERPPTMAPKMVVIPYTREFPHPARACFDWLTDYSDQDPSLTSEIVKGRSVVSREGDRIVLDVDTDLFGRRVKGRAEVRVYPDELRYEARSLHGDGKGVLYEYQLTELAPGRTRFEVRYGTRVRRLRPRIMMMLAQPFIKRRIHTMWEGFAAAMAADLAEPGNAARREAAPAAPSSEG